MRPSATLNEPMPLTLRQALHLTLTLVLGLAALAARAELGGTQASLALDQANLGASLRLSKEPSYQLAVLTLPNGVRVREYLSASGQIFAIGWDGPQLPDLELLLGNHHPSYLDAMGQRSRGVRVQRPDLVIESGGMMRAYVGRAYLPTLLPAGVRPQDIQ